VWVVVVIILDPISYQSQNGFSIWQRIDAHLIALERFTKASNMPLDCGLATGVKHGFRPS